MSTSSSTLNPLSQELLTSWRRFAHQWGSLARVALIPVLPLLLIFIVRLGGPNIPEMIHTIVTGLAVTTFILLAVPARIAIFKMLVSKKKQTAGEAFQAGINRFWPYIATEILLVLILAASLLPSAALNAWVTSSGGQGVPAVPPIIIGIFTILLALPALGFATILAFAPVMVATDSHMGPITALKRSARLTSDRKNFWAVWGRLSFWVLAFVLICDAVGPLPFASWLTPFFMSLIGAAFLVTVYEELRNGAQE